MSLDQLPNYLIIGSYLMGAASWMFLFREIKTLRMELSNLRVQLAKDQGLMEGRDYEARFVRLEEMLIKR